MAQSRRPTPSVPWAELQKKHPNHRFLNINPIYAIARPLINLIVARIPDFWNSADQSFERDLVRLGEGGFYHQSPIPRPPEPTASSAAISTQQQQADAAVTELLAENGLNPTQIDAVFKRAKKRSDFQNRRSNAYTAWLVMNPMFRSERDDLFRNLPPAIRNARRLPAHEISLIPKADRKKRVPTDLLRLHVFYNRWGLRTFLTPDLPVPMPLQEFDLVVGDVSSLASAGLVLFVPWHLIRDGGVRLQDVSAELRRRTQPRHLEGWLGRGGGRLGYTKLDRIFVLYRFLHLALRQRYPNQLQSRMNTLDEIFGNYLHAGADSVKKVRLILERNMK
jgi:hypothetical protein